MATEPQQATATAATMAAVELDFRRDHFYPLGLAHPGVADAVRGALDGAAVDGGPLSAFCERLRAASPSAPEAVIPATSSVEALNLAVEMARQQTGRSKVIALWASPGSDDPSFLRPPTHPSSLRQSINPHLAKAQHAPPPYDYRCLWDCAGECNLRCADFFDYIFARERDVAAVVADTVRTNGVLPLRDYWQRVREACDRHGALLILDESAVGLGRTGSLFAHDLYGGEADILVTSEGWAAGLFPLAFLLARPDRVACAAELAAQAEGPHNALAGAAAEATLATIQEQGLLESTTQLGSMALDRLRGMMQWCDLIGDVRGLGLLVAVEVVESRSTKAPAGEMAEKIQELAAAQGLLLDRSERNTLTLTPPLTVTEAEMERAVDVLEGAVREVYEAQD